MKQTLDASSCTSDGSCQLDLLRLRGLDILLPFMMIDRCKGQQNYRMVYPPWN